MVREMNEPPTLGLQHEFGDRLETPPQYRSRLDRVQALEFLVDYVADVNRNSPVRPAVQFRCAIIGIEDPISEVPQGKNRTLPPRRAARRR